MFVLAWCKDDNISSLYYRPFENVSAFVFADVSVRVRACVWKLRSQDIRHHAGIVSPNFYLTRLYQTDGLAIVTSSIGGRTTNRIYRIVGSFLT